MKRLDLDKVRTGLGGIDNLKKRVYVDMEGVDLGQAVELAKKSNKDYIEVAGWASTTLKNSHGFRILSKAWEHPDSFKRYDLNNIVLFNHKRDYPVGTALSREVKENEGLWVGLRLRRNALLPTGEKLGDLVEDGTLKTLSVGIDILEFDFVEAGDNLDIFATAVCLGEISMVSVPSDYGAVVSAKLEIDKVIQLSYVEETPVEIKQEESSMKAIALSLGLPETATEAEITAELQKRQTAAATLEATNKKLAAQSLVQKHSDKVGEQDKMKSWALAYAEKDPAGFELWAENAPLAVPPTTAVTQAATAAATASTAAPATAPVTSATLTKEDEDVRKGLRVFKDSKTMEELSNTTPDVAMGWVFPGHTFILTKQDERTLEKRRRADEVCGVASTV